VAVAHDSSQPWLDVQERGCRPSRDRSQSDSDSNQVRIDSRCSITTGTRSPWWKSAGPIILEMSADTAAGRARHAAPDIPTDWLAEFEAAARRPLRTRFRYAFIRTYKPVLDDEPFRAFDSTADYRRWCEENLPEWLGYGRV